MGGVGDIMTVMLVLGGAYILIKSGKLEEILGGDFKLPALPGLPAPGGSDVGEESSGPTAAGPTTPPVAAGGSYPFAECSGGPSDRAQWCSKHPCLIGEEATGTLTIKNVSDQGEEVSIKMR